jgi:TfoX/Sxy family transcriptional regulator of competence genes
MRIVRAQGERMPYDEHIAARIRKVLDKAPGISEMEMFGGIAFLYRGLMFIGVSGHTVMARVGKALYEDSLARAHVRVMDFTGKPMAGYVFIDEPGISTENALRFWVTRCVDFVKTLPPKVKKK